MLVFENPLLLMFVTTLPFATATLVDFLREGGASARWAALLYGISNMRKAISFTALLARMTRHGLLRTPVTGEVVFGGGQQGPGTGAGDLNRAAPARRSPPGRRSSLWKSRPLPTNASTDLEPPRPASSSC